MPLTRVTGNVIADGTITNADISPSVFRPAGVQTYYIAPRTDGIAGTGSQNDPYDGSTAAKFDNLIKNVIPADSTIHLMEGTFETFVDRNQLSPNNTNNWKNRVNVIGEGIDKTIIKVIGRAAGNINSVIEIYGDNVIVKDLTIDCNFQATRDIASASAAVLIYGYNAKIQNVKAINFGGAGANEPLRECFVFAISGDDGIVEDCVATNPQPNSSGFVYVSVCLLGWINFGYMDGKPMRPGANPVIKGLKAIGPDDLYGTFGSIVFQPSGPVQRVEGCHIKNATVGFYADSFKWDNSYCINNVFENCGVACQWIMGLDQYKDQVPGRTFIKNNTIRLGPNTLGWGMYLGHSQSTFVEGNSFDKMPIGFITINSTATTTTIRTDVAHGFQTGESVHLFPFQQNGVVNPYAQVFANITKINAFEFSFQTNLNGYPTGWLYSNKTYSVGQAIWLRGSSRTKDYLNGASSHLSVKNNIFEVTNRVPVYNVSPDGVSFISHGEAFSRIGAGGKIQSISKSGDTVTVTTTNAHELVSKQYIYISGVEPWDYNGFFEITVTGNNTFTYILEKTIANTGTARARVFTRKPVLNAEGLVEYIDSELQVQSIVAGPNIPGSGQEATITTTTPHGLNNETAVILYGIIPNYWSNPERVYDFSNPNQFKIQGLSYNGTQQVPEISMSYDFRNFISLEIEDNYDQDGLNLFGNAFTPTIVKARYDDPKLNGIVLDRAINKNYPPSIAGLNTKAPWWDIGERIYIEPGKYIMPKGIPTVRQWRNFIGRTTNPKDVVISTVNDLTNNPSFGSSATLFADLAPNYAIFENITFVSGKDAIFTEVWITNAAGVVFRNCIFEDNEAKTGSVALGGTGYMRFENCIFNVRLRKNTSDEFSNIGGFYNCQFNIKVNNQCNLRYLENTDITIDNDKFIYTEGIFRNCKIVGNTNDCSVQLGLVSPTMKGKLYYCTIQNANVRNVGEVYFTTIKPSTTQTYSLLGAHTIYNVGATKPKDPGATITTLTNIT